MKKIILILSIFSFACNVLLGNGVVVNKAKSNSYLKLMESSVFVTIESQVAKTVSLQTFKNNITNFLQIKYTFPLPEDASATRLRYKINGTWYNAMFAAVPQDTTTGGWTGEEDHVLKLYLGDNPLYYDIDQTILRDSTIIVELTYVELLKYKFGQVNYVYPNNYQTIQADQLSKQQINVTLNSERTIENIELVSHSPAEIDNTGNLAMLYWTGYNSPASNDYMMHYNLNLNELGLFSLSTYLPDSIQKDSYGRGFFSFIVEPDPSDNTAVIEKVFTLVIDRSGSMSGNKIVQARDAANFIVDNLNEGDKFNIISFSGTVSSFRSGHVDFNITNQNAAIAYINSLIANGSTNISGAFDLAIPQFSVADANTANIIIFFTDGEQTSGITNTDLLIPHINNLIAQSEKQISLFTFGIGEYTNERLLTSIANSNNGASEFLLNNELEEVITNFYLMIRNPVLLNTEIEFSPSIIGELYPKNLPNLYKGQQMIIVGRYIESAELTTRLTGNAYANTVEYNYTTNLSDSLNTKLQFLTKIWAKSKIDYLMDQYYLNVDNLNVSDSIKNEIIKLSLDYGVVSQFTSFQGGETYVEWEDLFSEENNLNVMSNEFLEVTSIYPNPCKDFIKLAINTKETGNDALVIKLLNSTGQVVYITSRFVNPNSPYEFNINIKDLNLDSGIYFISIQYKTKIISSKIVVR
ncbi:MAG: VWA domain-containing protein [Bacteroidetes bacterium]|nr:VWA domain-containing protein [Bacteroidota bacterium]